MPARKMLKLTRDTVSSFVPQDGQDDDPLVIHCEMKRGRTPTRIKYIGNCVVNDNGGGEQAVQPLADGIDDGELSDRMLTAAADWGVKIGVSTNIDALYPPVCGPEPSGIDERCHDMCVLPRVCEGYDNPSFCIQNDLCWWHLKGNQCLGANSVHCGGSLYRNSCSQCPCTGGGTGYDSELCSGVYYWHEEESQCKLKNFW